YSFHSGLLAPPSATLFPYTTLFRSLRISPLLEGIRTLSGEKIQWYLASELRDRIRNAKVRVTVIDKLARKQYEVEPRAYEGRLLDRKSTRLNSSHRTISYAVFCLKK